MTLGESAQRFRFFYACSSLKSFALPKFVQGCINILVNACCSNAVCSLLSGLALLCILSSTNMAHITDQYGPYYQPIWPILLTNMAHITDQYGPYYRPIWPILVSACSSAVQLSGTLACVLCRFGQSLPVFLSTRLSRLCVRLRAPCLLCSRPA